MVRLNNDSRDVFAKNFAEKYQNKELTFENLYKSYVDMRSYLLISHDLMFKLGLIEDYYYNPKMTLLLQNPEKFLDWIRQVAPEYDVIFKIYSLNLLDSSKSTKKITEKLICKSLRRTDDPNQLIELAKIANEYENRAMFLKIAKKLLASNEDQLSNPGFVNDYHVIISRYYYDIGEYDLSLQYADELLSVFEGNEFYYPFTRYVDSFADVMKFLSKETSRNNIYHKIVKNILGNQQFQQIQDIRLIAQIYLNLTSGSVKHLDPDYVYNLALELYYETEADEELNANYFIQVNKFNILNILSDFNEFYNLAISLDDYKFSPILNNKYSIHNYISILKLYSHAKSYEYDASFDQSLFDETILIISDLYEYGSLMNVNLMVIAIDYMLKFDQFDQAQDIARKLTQNIIESKYLSNDQKVGLVLYLYNLFNEDLELRSAIQDFSSSHYIKDKSLRYYSYSIR